MRARPGRLYLPVITLLTLVLALPAAAGVPREHDGGFFLRLSAGGGWATTSIDDAGETLELSGATGDLNFAIGGIVSPNLAVHATMFGWLVEDPDVDLNGNTGVMENADLDMSGFGAGITYYFMPINIYISGSAGIAALTADTPGGESETDNGLAVDVSLGKEWWVSDRWGIGVAGGYSYHSVPDGGVDADWTGHGLAVRFTATFN